MFITLLLVTFLIAVAVTTVVGLAFQHSMRAILQRIFVEEIGRAWQRYMTFAIYVVGISGGVRIWELEKYITPRNTRPEVMLNSDRWALEVYRTCLDTLQATAWLLLAFFIVAIIAYAAVRVTQRVHEAKP